MKITVLTCNEKGIDRYLSVYDGCYGGGPSATFYKDHSVATRYSTIEEGQAAKEKLMASAQKDVDSVIAHRKKLEKADGALKRNTELLKLYDELYNAHGYYSQYGTDLAAVIRKRLTSVMSTARRNLKRYESIECKEMDVTIKFSEHVRPPYKSSKGSIKCCRCCGAILSEVQYIVLEGYHICPFCIQALAEKTKSYMKGMDPDIIKSYTQDKFLNNL